MKTIVYIAASLLALTTLSCNKNDDNPKPQNLEGKNKVTIDFDAAFGANALILGTSYLNENNERLTVNAFDYIVSNFTLVKEDGTEFIYPKNDSYFIVSEGGEGKEKSTKVVLNNVPAGVYTQIKFGIGVDQERYQQGQAVQQSFWEKAEAYNMTWSWQAGYKFVVQEGTFTSPTVTEATPYKMHIASRGTAVDLYKTVSLPMDKALVAKDKSPLIHMVVDASKMLTADHKIKLSDESEIMGGEKAAQIAENNRSLFVVHHVHNGGGHDHDNH